MNKNLDLDMSSTFMAWLGQMAQQSPLQNLTVATFTFGFMHKIACWCHALESHNSSSLNLLCHFGTLFAISLENESQQLHIWLVSLQSYHTYDLLLMPKLQVSLHHESRRYSVWLMLKTSSDLSSFYVYMGVLHDVQQYNPSKQGITASLFLCL